MTVIAYKDGVLAADKQSTFQGMRTRTTKVFRLCDGRLVGASGNSSMCREMVAWLSAGALPEEFQDKEKSTSLLVIELDGSVLLYDDGPMPIKIEDKFIAIGSGRDYAMAAMHMGAGAVRAVEVTCVYETSCGMGIDSVALDAQRQC